MIGRLGIVGLGLIGGSLAFAARRAGICTAVLGADQNGTCAERALALGAIDRVVSTEDLPAAADTLVLAVPMGAMRAVLAALAPGLRGDSVVTDVGSVKGSVIADAEATLGSRIGRFVGGHPIAGTEKSGIDAAFAELFEGRRVLITPTPASEADAVERVRLLWRAAGAVVEALDWRHHDEVLAATSHLPHMLAFGLVDSLARKGERAEIFRYAAGGFRDFTRIASSDPVMWRDVCIHNRAALLNAMAAYRADLDELAEAIERGDAAALEAIFRRAKRARDTFCC